MNFYFVLFCIAGVLCSSELGFIFFLLLRNNAWQRNLKKRLLIDSYSSYVVLLGFYTQQNVNSAANFVFTSKIGLPRVVPVLRWVLFVRQIFVAPHLEFEQHMHSSHPRPDTVSLTQLESRGVCPTGFAAPIKSLNQDIFKFNSTTVRPRSEKPLQTSASRNFFFHFLGFQ